MAADKYATIAQVKKWAPYSAEEFDDLTVEDAIESATREVQKTTRRKWSPVDDPEDYNDIEIITSLFTGELIQSARGNYEGAAALRTTAMHKLRSLMSSTVEGEESKATDTINVYSSPRSYYMAKTLDPSQTTIKPYKSRY